MKVGWTEHVAGKEGWKIHIKC